MYKNMYNIKLISINSPFTKKLAVDVPLTIRSDDIFSFLKLIFNDDLNNVYRLTYNLVSMAGFTPEYLDSITPAEQYLYWVLHLQKANKEEQEYNRANNSSDSNLNYDGIGGLPKGKQITRSEFTS